MRAIIITIALLLPASALATSFAPVGGALIVLPAPHGYQTPGEDLRAWQHLLEQFNPEGSRVIRTYLERKEMAAIRAGRTPSIERFLQVHVIPATEFLDIDVADFALLKQAIKQDLAQHAGAGMSRDIAKLNEKLQDITGKLDSDTRTLLSNPITFPPHSESTHTLGYTTAVAVAVQHRGTHHMQLRANVEMLILVKNRVLMLRVGMPADELLLAKQTAASWAARILAAN